MQDLSEEQLKVLKDEAGRVEQKLKEDPKDVASLRDLSSLSAALGDPKKSRSLAEQLVKLDAEDYRSWLALVRYSEESHLYAVFAVVLELLPACIAAVISSPRCWSPGLTCNLLAISEWRIKTLWHSCLPQVAAVACTRSPFFCHLLQIVGIFKEHRKLVKACL